ncbi:MAG: 4Fe-4S binding protein [Nitrospinae bacterium]|nr:4Fe-4S binding protein [Nitrospinota bacterium]
MPVVVDPEVCIGCQSCVDVCPVGAISMVDDKANINQEVCVLSKECLDICPVEAIKEED